MNTRKLLLAVIALFGLLGAVSVSAVQQGDAATVEKVDIDSDTGSGDVGRKCPPFC